MALPAALISLVTGGVSTLIDRLIPDKAEAQKAKLELEAKLLELATSSQIAQMEVNKAEAQHRSLYVAGWRPFIGWTCGGALAWQFVLAPMAVWLSAALGSPLPPPPSLDEMLWELLLGMLGIASLRSWEKSRGLTR